MMKNFSRHLFVSSIVGSALIFYCGMLFKPHGWAWLVFPAAGIVTLTQAAVHYNREKLLCTQHHLITRHVKEVLGDEAVPHSHV
jgi:hypothetical protein